MGFIELVGRAGQRNDVGLGQVVQFMDFFAKSWECHVVEVIVCDDQIRAEFAGRLQGRRAVLEPDDVISRRRRDLFDHPADGRAAVDDKDGWGHENLRLY